MGGWFLCAEGILYGTSVLSYKAELVFGSRAAMCRVPTLVEAPLTQGWVTLVTASMSSPVGYGVHGVQ